MEYFPYVIACGGLILIASSMIDLSKIKSYFAKDKQPVADVTDLLSEYIRIRKILVVKLDATKMAEVDKSVLDEFTEGSVNGK
jgi:hypothetical protein